MTVDFDGVAEVCLTRGGTEHIRVVSFPTDSAVGQVACHECFGSGWWGWVGQPDVDGPCIDCKGTGRLWVGLW